MTTTVCTSLLPAPGWSCWHLHINLCTHLQQWNL